MSDFTDDLSRVLRYSMDAVENMLGQLASPQHLHTRAGTPKGDMTFRGALADALQERDREGEADLLRSGKHVVVDGGTVKPGRFAVQDVVDGLRRLAVEHNNTLQEPHWFRHTIEPVERGIKVTSHRPYGHPPDISVYPPEELNDRLTEHLRRELDRQANADTMMPEGIDAAGDLIESLLTRSVEEPVAEEKP